MMTIVLSTCTTLWRSLYTYIDFLTKNDLKYNYAARVPSKPLSQMPLEISICLVDTYLPLAILMYNIKTINFEKYLKSLLKGCSYGKHHSTASIFIQTKEGVDENSEDYIHGHADVSIFRVVGMGSYCCYR